MTLALGAAVLAACVGTDPVVAEGTPTDGGAQEVASPAPVDATATVAPGHAYGVFLSSEALPTNFGADAASPGVQAVADAVCTRLAASANLDRPEHYHATLVTERGSEAAFSILNLLRTVDAGDSVWCSIGPGTPARPSCDRVGLVFDSTTSVETGPVNGLVTNERGAPAPIADGVRSHFYSGLYFEPGVPLTSTPPRNCDGWSKRLDARSDAGAGVPDAEASFGFGNAVARDGGFAWFGEAYALCDRSYALPLFCMELP